VQRTVSYPEFPRSRLVFDADVTALSASEWSTDLTVSGTYDGPTDIVGVRDYEIDWTASGKTLLEKGRATLVTSSGRSIRSEWSSTITAKDGGLRGFPSAGEVVSVSISPFKVEGSKMSYTWQGTVSPKGK
jgi:hypothetical protein